MNIKKIAIMLFCPLLLFLFSCSKSSNLPSGTTPPELISPENSSLATDTSNSNLVSGDSFNTGTEQPQILETNGNNKKNDDNSTFGSAVSKANNITTASKKKMAKQNQLIPLNLTKTLPLTLKKIRIQTQTPKSLM